VILNGVFGLTIISLITASNRSPGSPDPDLAPDGAREKRHTRAEGWDEDIPLRSLRDARNRSENVHRQTRPSDIMVDGVEYDGNAILGDTPSTSSSHYPEISPFPLNLSPFVPTTATDAGEDQDEDTEQYEVDVHPNEVSPRRHGSGEEDEVVGDVHERLLSEPLSGMGISRGTIFAKSSSGGIRWCKKCDNWKPDRCHHCRHCRKCTLKSRSASAPRSW
jgi:palmitoyltransferase